jgi:hypothetical protein
LKPNGKCSNGSSNLDHRQRRNRLHGGKVFEAGGEMNEKKWTQGEWRISDCCPNTVKSSIPVGEGDSTLVALVYPVERADPEGKWSYRGNDAEIVTANTALIAAAPKLYEALELVLNDYRTDGCSDADCAVCAASKAAFNVAIAALAAARGEK